MSFNPNVFSSVNYLFIFQVEVGVVPMDMASPNASPAPPLHVQHLEKALRLEPFLGFVEGIFSDPFLSNLRWDDLIEFSDVMKHGSEEISWCCVWSVPLGVAKGCILGYQIILLINLLKKWTIRNTLNYFRVITRIFLHHFPCLENYDSLCQYFQYIFKKFLSWIFERSPNNLF